MSHPNATVIPCTACGEAGHRASHCKSLSVPPLGFHTGGNGGGGHSHDDDEKATALLTVRLFGQQNGSKDDETLSKLLEPGHCYHTFPSIPSSVVV